MTELLEHPAVQGGVAPFVVALIVAAALGRTRYAWIAIVAGYATMIALSTGFSFSPLSAVRKIVLLCLLVAVVGIVADAFVGRSRPVVLALAVVAGVAAAWTFLSVLAQREGAGGWLAGAGLLAFAAVLTYLMLSLREDPVRTAAAGLGLGLATGIAAVLSASIGFMLAGIAVAASAGALLLVWVVLRKPAPPGAFGALAIGVMIALFAEGTLMLAELPWYALLALLLVPLAMRLPVREDASVFFRAFVLALYALAAAAVPIALAWYATRGTPS